MKEKNKRYKDLLDAVISKALIMNASTDLNNELDNQVKVVQRATSLSIIEPLFEYMETIDHDEIKTIVAKYKDNLKTLKENGVIESIEDVEKHINELKNKMKSKIENEKDNNNNG